MLLIMTQRCKCKSGSSSTPPALHIRTPDRDERYSAPGEGRTIWPPGLDQETAPASRTRNYDLSMLYFPRFRSI